MYDKSTVNTYTTPSGLKRYRLPVQCAQMNKHRNISSDTPEFAIHKATLQEMIWADQWQERAALKHKKLGLEMNGKRSGLKVSQKHKIAEGRTNIAQYELNAAYNVLAQRLEAGANFDWEFFKSCAEYPFPKPELNDLPPPPARPLLPREPSPTDSTFQPKLEAMDSLRPGRRLQKEQEARARFEAVHAQWERMCAQIKHAYQQQLLQYKSTVDARKAQHERQVQAWEQGNAVFMREREACIRMVEHKKAAYLEHEPHAVLDYFDMALAHFSYPFCFPHSFELDYYVNNRALIIDYLMPPLRALPRLARVLYNEEDDLFHEIILTEGERNSLYARLLHELPLSVFYELFAVDTAVALAAIGFRGYIFLDENKDSGKPPTRVVEVQIDRATFAATDFFHGDSSLIFEDLGGVIHPLE